VYDVWWHAGNNNGLNLTTKAGLDRTPKTYAADAVYTWADFQPYGWTRTLSPNWFEEIPILTAP
jgi:hypothetical protein